MNIVLLEPEMPSNTGNIGRTCVATDTALHLIKRAGLDYWDKLKLYIYSDFEDFIEKNPKARTRLFMATTKAEKNYTQVSFEEDDYIMFGKESAGIPEEILVRDKESCIRIPMWGDIRSLNLSNSVSVILYEAYRQIGFRGLNTRGKLHRLSWQ